MSFISARDQMIEIVKNATVTTFVGGSGDRFRYNDAVNRERLGTTREFFFEVSGGAVGGPLTSITRIWRADMILGVFYQDVRSSKKYDELVVSDYQQLADALLDVTQWNTAVSKIRTITVAGSSIVNYDLEAFEDSRILTITISLEYE
tara:strand:- start:4848 stop:5291 length:444 start_codon:yes stop_codon:yes gene_type:complete